MIQIVNGINQIEEIKELIIQYTLYLNRDLSFQNIEEELKDLKYKYTGENGKILAALANNKVVGCVAYHKHNDKRCEMKRLFVLEEYRNLHIGESLIQEIIKLAKENYFQEMVLDTIEPLKPAIHLYKKFGFIETESYYDNPMSDVIYMKKIL